MHSPFSPYSQRLYGQYILYPEPHVYKMRINGTPIRKNGAHASDTDFGRQYRLYAYTNKPDKSQTIWHLLCVVQKQLREQMIDNAVEEQVFPQEGDTIELHFNATQAVGRFHKVIVLSCDTNASSQNPYGTAALLEVEGNLFKPYVYYETNEVHFKTMLLNND